MPLTQTQIIQSLGEALTWFERELEWGVSPAELSHLTGRIGELYAAMMTRGQMALAIRQRGYDVVSADGEQISVKTVTTSVQVRFNPNTLDEADRIIVLRINIDEDEGISVEELLDIRRGEFESRLRYLSNGMIDFPVPPRHPPTRSMEEQKVQATATFGRYVIQQFESGSIGVREEGEFIAVAKPVLREIASEIGVDLLNANDRPKNTRQLGAGIIKALNGRER